MVDLPEEITYWTISGVNDGTGINFNPGIKVPSRSASHTEIFVDDAGKETQTRFAVYAEVLIPEKAYIFRGDAEGDLVPVKEAREVIATSENITMTNLRRMLI